MCVVDMSLLGRLWFDASLSESSGDVVAEDRVLCSEVFDLDMEGVEAGGDRLWCGSLGGGDGAVVGPAVVEDRGAEFWLAVEPGFGDVRGERDAGEGDGPPALVEGADGVGCSLE